MMDVNCSWLCLIAGSDTSLDVVTNFLDMSLVAGMCSRPLLIRPRCWHTQFLDCQIVPLPIDIDMSIGQIRILDVRGGTSSK